MVPPMPASMPCTTAGGMAWANRASRLQGRAFLDACARIFPAELGALRERAREAHLRCHLAPVFGTALRSLGVALEEAQFLRGLDQVFSSSDATKVCHNS